MKAYTRYLLALLTAAWLGIAPGAHAGEPASFAVEILATLEPERQGASVEITVNRGELLKHLNFSNRKGNISNIQANGTLRQTGQRVYWDLPQGKATLSYFVNITHERSPGKYDALINKDWALFRGDDLVPAMHIDTGDVMGSYSVTTLEFVLPESWKSVHTGWPREEGQRFRIDNPERRFDRPTGWIIAGKIGTRSTTRKSTVITVAAPMGQNYQRMDALVFLRFVWPEIKQAFVQTPPRLLIVGADDPMWRGGLSAPNSLFLHSDRPLVSENGTSSLVHELTHMVTRISGAVTDSHNDDWIAEGLAEFYSVELLYRAHGHSTSRRAKILENLAQWGADVTHLRRGKSTGPVTARAVVLLDQLDQEIQRRSDGRYSIDDVTRSLMKRRNVSLADLRAATESLIGPDIRTLDTPLLR
ncbi:MAG: hypothetical protein KDI09_14470 [Halioglobus sp.]|nr:hypothetical protein [Halioglobus sp.]